MQKRRPMSAVVDEKGHVVLLNHDKCFASEPLAKLEDDEVSRGAQRERKSRPGNNLPDVDVHIPQKKCFCRPGVV